MDESDIRQRWSEYIEKLYDDPNRSDEPLLFDGILSNPEILVSEVRKAIKTARIRKAPGTDNVRVEMLKLLNETALKYLKHLMNEVYERGRLTKEMCQSIFIPLPKKAGTVQCDKFRTISLMSHLNKNLTENCKPAHEIKDHARNRRLSIRISSRLRNKECGFHSQSPQSAIDTDANRHLLAFC